MARILGIALIIAIWFVFGSANAHTPVCFNRIQGELQLMTQHMEIAYAIGTTAFKNIDGSHTVWTAKFWRSSVGTWTLSFTSPDNQRICWFAAGGNFRMIGQEAQE
jgi:hypothetical protein